MLLLPRRINMDRTPHARSPHPYLRAGGSMSRFVFVSAMLLAGSGASTMLLAQDSPNSPPSAASSGQQRAARADDHNCIRETGSHIPAKKGQCLPVNGRSYSQQDLQRTGEPELGRALQKLDPRITVHGH
ncbi:hypothetical protein [Rhodanobacter denitrificans]|nr:hypothetical protein [Rhodanobacter denitrificans]UJM94672.1 hypothetical protein LRK32_04335 [Rhodanobacter denitrificans]UJM98202.1 hypothetical protein LRK44_04340 [Rhodanobacter denitrificans]UJN22384.1 hypothetical protein LRK54_04155 [Rhodanobacter denitrificans]